MAVKRFVGDDNEYLKWMHNNPFAFVVNPPKSRTSSHFVLHKAKCHHITTTAGLSEGAYTKRAVKIGSDSKIELEAYLKRNYPGFTEGFNECNTCKPTEKIQKRAASLILFPDDIQESEIIVEGAKKHITVNSYERDTRARQKCIEHYGCICKVCEVDFESRYGAIGRGFIHVHHLKEISSIGRAYIINPIEDLRPVCPNCHAILHQKKPCFSIEELIAIIKSTSKKVPPLPE